MHSLHNDVEIWRIIASDRELSDGSSNVSNDCPCDAPFCTVGTCRAFQCADCASPDETLDTDWSDIVFVEGNASLNCFRYDGNVGGVIVQTVWVSLSRPRWPTMNTRDMTLQSGGRLVTRRSQSHSMASFTRIIQGVFARMFHTDLSMISVLSMRTKSASASLNAFGATGSDLSVSAVSSGLTQVTTLFHQEFVSRGRSYAISSVIANVAKDLSVTLDLQIRLKFPFSVPGILVLPETFLIDSLNAYINVFMTTNTMRTFQLFKDFAAINFKDCFEVNWPNDMTTLASVFEVRLSAFRSVPPKLQPREDTSQG